MTFEIYTPDNLGRRKIAADQVPQLVADLHNTDCTLEQLGAKYGVTRERIRQLEKKWGIDGTKRRKQRTQKIVQSRVQHDRFGDAYNAVWKEAESRGFKVAAWADRYGIVKKSALFINARRCWISHIAAPVSTGGKRLYWHVTGYNSSVVQGTRIIVCDHNEERSFYIFMLGEIVPMYIPATPTVRAPNVKTPMNDYSQFKNAWHLLGDCHEPK